RRFPARSNSDERNSVPVTIVPMKVLVHTRTRILLPSEATRAARTVLSVTATEAPGPEAGTMDNKNGPEVRCAVIANAPPGSAARRGDAGKAENIVTCASATIEPAGDTTVSQRPRSGPFDTVRAMPYAFRLGDHATSNSSLPTHE